MNRDGVRNGCKVVNYIAYHDPALVNGAGMMKRMMKGRGEKLKCGGGAVQNVFHFIKVIIGGT